MSKRNLIGVVAIFIFHLVGAIGMSIEEFKPLFVSLTPAHLLLTLFLFLWSDSFSLSQIKLFVILFMIGFWVEVVGVKTGILFGIYKYGPTLGFKFLDVPLLIGVNWFLLAVSAFGTVSYLTKNKFILIIASATLMVFLDFIIEPVAIHLDFWTWQNGIIPIQNYIMWWFVSLLMQWIIYSNKLKFSTSICFAIFISQILFFTILNLHIGTI
jgi:putative membrane protein